MQTLAYGIKLPELDDDSAIFFPALEGNISQWATHNHDGVNSAILPAKTQAISHTSWAALAGFTGTYTQTVTMPTGYSFDTCSILIKLANGSVIYPSIARTSATQYVITINDNSLDLTAVYSS